MKITQRHLRQIIREELERNMNEGFFQNAMAAALGGRARRDREADPARRAELDVAPETPYKPYEYKTPAAVARAAARDERDRLTARAWASHTIWDKSALEMSEDEYEARRQDWLDNEWAGKYKDYTVTNWSTGVEDSPLATYLASGEWRSDPDLAGLKGGDDMMLRKLLPTLDVNGADRLSPKEVNDIVNLWDDREISPYAKSYDDAVYSAKNSYW